jgi:hypothetical protein
LTIYLLWECRNEEPEGLTDFPRLKRGIPYSLIDEYAGIFPDKSGSNCFAAAAAMVIGDRTIQNLQQSHVLIQQWLHQEPFFRLLKGQGYSKFMECCLIRDLTLVQPPDVLIWYTQDGTARHAAFAMSNELVFQKNSQGWDSPWQVLKVTDIWYNDYLKTGGHISIYRLKGTIKRDTMCKG